MQIAVTGSIAMDHLMRFPGRFAESLVVEQLDRISLSFLVEDLQIKRGGVAPNVCFGLAALGLSPLLVGSVGEDFAEYRAWLDRHGVLTWPIHISQTQHTARFVCTTDADNAQIGSFYTGAMAEARQIELAPIAEVTGGLDLVMISPNDPEAMQRHTEECRARGYRFIADPSQQLAWLDGPDIIRLIEGADYLFSNDYEDTLISQKTGWSHDEIVSRVGVRVMTRGRDGARIEIAGRQPIEVPIAPETTRLDPTGVGDAFRAGFIAGLSWGVSLERCAQVGSLLASYVIAVVGTQEYRFHGSFGRRFAAAYGPEAAAEIAPHLAELRL
ncbi:adenosine kinase [Microlunatus phosphovorus NM-1]|uniref:Adenosine kinase n=1 Tax=Microlunatus phosphovorus (strain ATCC 700054 / DSM 10555 / JCM 9379 / NBRC 101784 / NCIMB 13414 / VKM Ac-1990 / NM-1) TaxID=1032480 RepID=F5XRU6_MICPN|nr:carbohydrate kinase family protein [Microlunatus phosphovorus]BAK37159.1 adenosine kinase [Microlunatus phosphovorus NM-1]